MEIETLNVVIVVAGVVLIYGAVNDKNPLSLIKTVLQGGKPADAQPFAGGK